MSAGEASKRDTKSKSHPSMRLAPVRVFSRKHPLTRVHPRSESYFGSQRGWILIFVTIQILVVLLIGESKFLTNQKSTTQIWVVTRHQYGISAFVSQTSFRGETSGGVAKCWLFSQANLGQLRVEMPRHLMRVSWQKGSTYA